jgi:hypothetical protein
MPSTRRLRAFFLLVVLAVLITLYLTASARQTRTSQFYTKTQDALAAAREAKEAGLSGPGGDELDVGKRLREAEEAAKKAADRKGDAFHGEEGRKQASIVKENVAKETVASVSAGGETKHGGPRLAKVPGLAMEEGLKKQAAENRRKDQESSAETKEDHEVKDELNSILKRSPGELSTSNPALNSIANIQNCSDNFFQILLPLLRKSQAHPSRILLHQPAALRRGIGPPQTRTTTTIKTRRHDRTPDSPEYSYKRKKHRRWRRCRCVA